MPDRGLLLASTVEDVGFGPDEPLVIAEAAWLQITFEVDREAALALMPEDVGRPIPPYGRLLVGTAPGMSFALLSVGGRYRMMPRNILVEGISDGGAARLGAAFGSGIREGRVTLTRDGAMVTANIANREGPLATVTLSDMYAIEPTMLRWDAFVAFARQDGAAVIAEVTPAHETPVAFLSKSARVEIDPGVARNSPWRRLRSLGVISACYVEGTLSFGGPAVQQTWG
jgi:hypothetical protein